MNIIQEIHNYLAEDIKAMNAVITSSLSAREELIKIISEHLSSAGGKRIRPVLTILTAKLFDYKGNKAIAIAAAVEFIHMATLLHDDVIDGSKMRRFLPTANTIWGSKASILVRDFLFSQSFKLMVSTGSLAALEVLSNASAIIAQGEVSQLVQLEQQKNTDEAEYLQIINAKTAELFGAACKVGSIIAGREDVADILQNFGLALGNIFQITDDALDYFSQSDAVGKNIGDDFYEGKITLPIILLGRKITAQNRVELQNLMISEKRSENDFDKIRAQMYDHNIQDDIKIYLNKLRGSALEFLTQIEVDNQAAQYLKQLVDFAINRSY